MKKESRKQARIKNRRRIRSTIIGTVDRPRLAFFRSSKNVYAQLINDDDGVTMASVSSLKEKGLHGSLEFAKKLGSDMAEMIKGKGIKAIVFDRGGFRYAGSVKLFADTVRAGGIEF